MNRPDYPGLDHLASLRGTGRFYRSGAAERRSQYANAALGHARDAISLLTHGPTVRLNLRQARASLRRAVELLDEEQENRIDAT